jgi:uncharacterized protein YggE
MGTLPTQAAGEKASALGGGGGGWVSTGGQFTEGLVVVGIGIASAEPEAAQVNVGVELRGENPAALVDEGAQKVEKIISAVHELGVSEEDIRTTGYNLWIETVHDPETGRPTGEVVYHLSHYVQVTLHDLNQVGELLAAVVEAGANTISGVNFIVEDSEALVEQARQQALENAATRADQMAAGLGITLGKPILVTETGDGLAPMEWGGRGGGGDMVETIAAPSISPGTFSVSVSVQIVYEIR